MLNSLLCVFDLGISKVANFFGKLYSEDIIMGIMFSVFCFMLMVLFLLGSVLFMCIAFHHSDECNDKNTKGGNDNA